MTVTTLRWPSEMAEVEELRAAGIPRLLLVEANGTPPTVVCPLEDWVRLPAQDRDIDARIATLTARARPTVEIPTLDDDGLLRYGGRWVALSPVERALAGALVDRLGSVVSREALARRAWPAGAPTRNALDVHVLRLRRRIITLNIEIRTVRRRGYLLQPCELSAAPPA